MLGNKQLVKGGVLASVLLAIAVTTGIGVAVVNADQPNGTRVVTVSFDATEAKDDKTENGLKEGVKDIPKNQTVSIGGNATKPDKEPTWDRHHFKEWTHRTQDPDDDTKTVSTPVDFDKNTFDKDETLYAHWQSHVTFESAVSDCKLDTDGYKVESFDLTDSVKEPKSPTCDGYDFSGWATTKEKPADSKSDTLVTDWKQLKASEDMTLYARWTKSTDQTDKKDESDKDKSDTDKKDDSTDKDTSDKTDNNKDKSDASDRKDDTSNKDKSDTTGKTKVKRNAVRTMKGAVADDSSDGTNAVADVETVAISFKVVDAYDGKTPLAGAEFTVSNANITTPMKATSGDDGMIRFPAVPIDPSGMTTFTQTGWTKGYEATGATTMSIKLKSTDPTTWNSYDTKTSCADGNPGCAPNTYHWEEQLADTGKDDKNIPLVLSTTGKLKVAFKAVDANGLKALKGVTFRFSGGKLTDTREVTSDADGMVRVTLPTSNTAYSVEEIAVPDGYDLKKSATTFNIWLKTTNMSKWNGNIGANGFVCQDGNAGCASGDWNGDYVVDTGDSDNHIPTVATTTGELPISFRAIDAENSAALKALKGVTFRFSNGGLTTPIEVTSDADGMVRVTLPTSNTAYSVEEVAVPDGYDQKKSATTLNLRLKTTNLDGWGNIGADGIVCQAGNANCVGGDWNWNAGVVDTGDSDKSIPWMAMTTGKVNLSFRSVDAADFTKPVKGVTWTFTGGDLTDAPTVVSDDDGMVRVTLPTSNTDYSIAETGVPDGYDLEASSIKFSLTLKTTDVSANSIWNNGWKTDIRQNKCPDGNAMCMGNTDTVFNVADLNDTGADDKNIPIFVTTTGKTSVSFRVVDRQSQLGNYWYGDNINNVSHSGGVVPLAGATFEITGNRLDGKTLTVTSDKNGIVRVPNLPTSSKNGIFFKQTTPPDGYSGDLSFTLYPQTVQARDDAWEPWNWNITNIKCATGNDNCVLYPVIGYGGYGTPCFQDTGDNDDCIPNVSEVDGRTAVSFRVRSKSPNFNVRDAEFTITGGSLTEPMTVLSDENGMVYTRLPWSDTPYTVTQTGRLEGDGYTLELNIGTKFSLTVPSLDSGKMTLADITCTAKGNTNCLSGNASDFYQEYHVANPQKPEDADWNIPVLTLVMKEIVNMPVTGGWGSTPYLIAGGITTVIAVAVCIVMVIRRRALSS